MTSLSQIPHWTGTLLDGLRRATTEAGIGTLKDTYEPGDFAVVTLFMPDQPDRTVCITPYLPRESLDSALTSIRVQFRTRAPLGHPRLALDDQDDIRDLWHRHGAVDFDGVRISRFERVSLLQLGKDATGRMEFTSNFELTGLRWLRSAAVETATP